MPDFNGSNTLLVRCLGEDGKINIATNTPRISYELSD